MYSLNVTDQFERGEVTHYESVEELMKALG